MRAGGFSKGLQQDKIRLAHTGGGKRTSLRQFMLCGEMEGLSDYFTEREGRGGRLQDSGVGDCGQMDNGSDVSKCY